MSRRGSADVLQPVFHLGTLTLQPARIHEVGDACHSSKGPQDSPGVKLLFESRAGLLNEG